MGITLAYFEGKEWNEKELNALDYCELIFGNEYDDDREYDSKCNNFF